MKEIKVLIRIDEATSNIGFAFERDKGSAESMEENLMLIGALDVLKEKVQEGINLKQRKLFK